MIQAWLDRWFPKRWFVGVVSLKVAGTRWGSHPWALEWEGCMGPLPSREAAEALVAELIEREINDVAK